ncbi:MAG: efflux RND transporter periplasmic adaptor subunit [Candidatus Kryptoniota bacterium]
MRKKALIIIVTSASILLIGILVLLKGSNSNNRIQDSNENFTKELTGAEQSSVVFPVSVAVVHRGELTAWVTTNGYCLPIVSYEVKPMVSGQVIEMSVFDGKPVKKGDLLFKIDDTQYKFDLERASDQLLRAQIEYSLQKETPTTNAANARKIAELDSLRALYEKSRRQYESGRMSKDQYERIKRDYEAMEIYSTVNREDVIAGRTGLTSATINYEKAKLDLQNTRVVSPIDGVVSDCVMQVGSYVEVGMLCMKIIDVSKIRIKCDVTETDLVKIHEGDPAEAEFIALPGLKLYGKVQEINPSVDIQKRTAVVTVVVDNVQGKVKAGMYASVKIGTSELRNVIIIPQSAVLVRDNRTLVFTVQDGLSQWKYVKLGRGNDKYYEVLDGLSVGDTLIVGGNYNLAHEARVKVVSYQQY